MKNVNEILNNSRKSVESLLVTNKGTKKETIYKDAIFESIVFSEKEKNKQSVTKLANSFAEFYKETYKVNDYSFSSVASENTKDKEIINNALAIIKKELKIK